MSGRRFAIWRFALGRLLMHAGLMVMPHGRVRAELSELLWTWRMRVMNELAAHDAIGRGLRHD